MDVLNVILLIVLFLLIIIYITHYIFLNKVNNEYQIMQKYKPNQRDTEELYISKSPSIITGEVEDWFIFDKKDKIDTKKLTKKVLDESLNKICHKFSLVKKYNIITHKKDFNTKINYENNTRHFIVVLKGDISVLLFNPEQYDKIDFIDKNISNKSEKNDKNDKNDMKNKKIKKNNLISKSSMYDKSKKNIKDAKYMEIKLHKEQILFIPYKWLYCYKCNQTSQLIHVNSESFFTLPIKMLGDKL